VSDASPEDELRFFYRLDYRSYECEEWKDKTSGQKYTL
jgi:hypothetical protein